MRGLGLFEREYVRKEGVIENIIYKVQQILQNGGNLWYRQKHQLNNYIFKDEKNVFCFMGKL